LPACVTGLYAIIAGRYFLVCGLVWLLLKRWQPAGGMKRAEISHDILLSLQTTGVFALSGVLALRATAAGQTRLYQDLNPQSWWQLPLSYGLVLVLQDTAFYFSHRLFHQPALYRWMHRGHHRSRRPTAWTSFAFDPGEALWQALILLAVTVVIPLHGSTLIAVLITMTIWAVVNHLGLEQLPPWFPHHWLGSWFIGPAHHGLHHRKPSVHFGLYFTAWDRWLGSEDPAYRRQLAQARQPPGEGRS